MKPRIGISTSLNESEQHLQLSYVQAIESAGGLPIIIPMLQSDDSIRGIAEVFDGLLITGGPAVCEGLIGDLPADLALCDPLRSHTDLQIAKITIEMKKPVLGICYGMQLLNSIFGGRIYADVQNQVKGALIHSEKRGASSHPVNLSRGSLLSRLVGVDEFNVNTRHIQAVAEVGRGLQISANAPDGVVEGIEDGHGLILGIQFHAERMPELMRPVFQHLVTEAEKYRIRQDTRLAESVLPIR